jgi:hypothetical protein
MESMYRVLFKLGLATIALWTAFCAAATIHLIG